MMRKLFLDDIRKPPDYTWDVVRSYDEFVAYIKEHGAPDVISFDHDLAFEHYPLNDSNLGYSTPPSDPPYGEYKEKTGYDCAKWIVENDIQLQQWAVHSLNPVGKANIRAIMMKHCPDKEIEIVAHVRWWK